MEAEVELSEEIEVECPHCRKKFRKEVTIKGITEVEPPDKGWGEWELD